MAEKYRLLKDVPGAKAGEIFHEQTRNGVAVLAIPGYDSPSFYKTVTNTEWFEPVEDRWKPKTGDCYCNIAGDCSIRQYRWYGTPSDERVYASGNCFRCEADAELAADKVRECLMQFHREFTR